MQYRNVEINLLPPELQPGPVVRYSFIINVTLVAVTVVFLVIDSALGMMRISFLGRDIKDKEQQLRDKAQVIVDYDELVDIEKHVDTVGRLIGLASVDYADVPLILARLAKIVPDGVHVERVISDQRAIGASTVSVRISLLSARPDEGLVLATLNAFKADSIFQECYLRSSEFEEFVLDPLLEQERLNWEVSGPGIDEYKVTNRYAFEIVANIKPPVDAGGSFLRLDNSDYFARYEPIGAAEAEAPDAAAASPPASGAPPGVTVTEVQ